MKLNVIETTEAEKPWYADGLRFTCSQCGNCCTGGPGYVWLTKVEIVRLAEFLRITPEQTVERYCRKINGRFSLKEKRNTRGEYDCIFLEEKPAPRNTGENQKIAQTMRTCPIYPVRPLQCRTWPFWPENLGDPEQWEHSARRCHGMNSGRKFTVDEIHAIRDAKDWTDNPPTSKFR